MPQIDATYEGSLHCSAVHVPSGAKLTTDAPKDNMGRGESFSPTDLVATALGTCILTTMGLVAQRHGLDLGAATARTNKIMTSTGPRRIARLEVHVHVPKSFDESTRQRLEHAGMHCPVHQSLHPDVQIEVTFVWRD
ncbi:MAG TPA: OsmC family protein [Tepidisphaeraceae bacterium]|jgi:putative redox protein|nr:OsmC family protein [Tepidisphaeraceae bacterium]